MYQRRGTKRAGEECDDYYSLHAGQADAKRYRYYITKVSLFIDGIKRTSVNVILTVTI